MDLKMKIEKIFKILKLCKLNQGDRKTVDGLENWYKHTGMLTDRQLDKLYSVYEKEI